LENDWNFGDGFQENPNIHLITLELCVMRRAILRLNT